MTEDPIVQEIHDIRAKLLEEHGGDIQKFYDSLLKKQEKSRADFLKEPLPSNPIQHVAEPSPPYPTP